MDTKQPARVIRLPLKDSEGKRGYWYACGKCGNEVNIDHLAANSKAQKQTRCPRCNAVLQPLKEGALTMDKQKYEIHVSSTLDEDMHFQQDYDTLEEAVAAADLYDEDALHIWHGDKLVYERYNDR